MGDAVYVGMIRFNDPSSKCVSEIRLIAFINNENVIKKFSNT